MTELRGRRNQETDNLALTISIVFINVIHVNYKGSARKRRNQETDNLTLTISIVFINMI
jgi:hypothetical protein